MKARISPGSQPRGLTFIELVVAIAVLAILLMIGMPSIHESIKNNRVAGQNNEFVAMLSFAKSEAIRRNENVTAEFTVAGSDWSGRVLDPAGEGAEPCVAEGALRCAENTRVALTGSSLELTFNNRGYLQLGDAWQTETFYLQHEDCSGQRQRRRIDLLPTGQISSCSLPCDSAEACP